MKRADGDQIELDRLGEDHIDLAKLRSTPEDERKIALVLSSAADPGMAQSAVDLMHAFARKGYRVTDIPVDGAALIRALRDGSSNNEETFPRGEYGFFFAALPRDAQAGITERWGAPERDPSFRESRLDCGAFAMTALRCGNVIVAVQPARGYDGDPSASQRSSERPPPHGYLAFYAWLADAVRAQAILHVGRAEKSIAF